jgi:hypothetical protein
MLSKERLALETIEQFQKLTYRCQHFPRRRDDGTRSLHQLLLALAVDTRRSSQSTAKSIKVNEIRN